MSNSETYKKRARILEHTHQNITTGTWNKYKSRDLASRHEHIIFHYTSKTSLRRPPGTIQHTVQYRKKVQEMVLQGVSMPLMRSKKFQTKLFKAN